MHGPAPPFGSSLPALVVRWAQETPHAPALVEERSSLTYAELDRQSATLARQLQGLGVIRGSVVALCLPRSISFVVAALAAMKTGGAYLPLEPSLPAQRLAFQIADAEAQALITTESLCRNKSLISRNVIFIDAKAADDFASSMLSCSEEIQEEDLAYVMYTSGTTGYPKGVEIPHRGLSNLIAWHQKAFQIVPTDRASHLASIGFDASVWEVWPYLASGASVYIGDEWLIKDPERLREWLLASKITCCFAPTRVAERLMELEWTSPLALRFLFTGGERLRRYPPASLPFEVVNNYGPTEYTVVASSSVVAPLNQDGHGPAIGRPIANTSIYLLDKVMKEVSPGTAGEIWIGGPGIARGYLGRPDLTSKTFQPNPFDMSSHSRLYRTGDLGRILPDGQIEFLGRADTQVKIRGARTEPEEVEAVLAQHPAVKEAAVVAGEVRPGDIRLAAFVVERTGFRVSANELQKFLQQRIPECMIPTQISLLREIPILPSGKMDRTVLQRSMLERFAQRNKRGASHKGRQSSSRGSARVAEGEGRSLSRSEVERGLQKVWQNVLRLHDIPPHADFFLDLGGDSLQAVQVSTEIERAFGARLPVSALLEKRTLAGLAKALSEHLMGEKGSALVALQPRGTREPIVCIHSHDGEILFCRHLPDFAGMDRPIYAFRAPAFAGGPVHFSVEAAAEAYLEELLHTRPHEGYSLFGFCYGGLVAFEMAQRLIAQGREVSFIGMFNTPGPGTLSRWPLGQISYLGKRAKTELQNVIASPAREKGRNAYRSAQNFCRMVGRSVKIEIWRLSISGASDESAQRLGKQMLDLEQIHIAAGKKYHPSHVFPGEISYFLSEELPYPYAISPEAGWRRFVHRVNAIRVEGAGETDAFRALMRSLATSVARSNGTKSHLQLRHSLPVNCTRDTY